MKTNYKLQTTNYKVARGFTQHRFSTGWLSNGTKKHKSDAHGGLPSTTFPSSTSGKSGAGFTLIEMIIYLAIVSIILVTLSYLIIDILGGQTKNVAGQEVNQNLRFITNYLIKDVKSAQGIGSLTADTLVLTRPADDITYNFDGVSQKITRQLGAAAPVDLNSRQLEVTGSFIDLSYLGRTKNVGINLIVSYKNPENLPDYNASTTVEFSVELRGRR